jgi:hypothetical protein
MAGKYISTAKGDNASIEASSGSSNVNEALGFLVILLISNAVNTYYVINANQSLYINGILCNF